MTDLARLLFAVGAVLAIVALVAILGDWEDPLAWVAGSLAATSAGHAVR